MSPLSILTQCGDFAMGEGRRHKADRGQKEGRRQKEGIRQTEGRRIDIHPAFLTARIPKPHDLGLELPSINLKFPRRNTTRGLKPLCCLVFQLMNQNARTHVRLAIKKQSPYNGIKHSIG
ncbi:MAG: hypothetical protein ACRC62_08175 [Microcoleus sp.]